MNCDELTQLLPDLVDGTLPEATRREAEAAFADCPDCQRQFELALQIHTFLVQLQSENEQFRVPPGFEQRLLARIQHQRGNIELFDLSSRAFAEWLLEFIRLVGGLVEIGISSANNRPQPA